MIHRLYFRYGMRWRHRYVPILAAIWLSVLIGGALAWANVIEDAMIQHKAEMLVQHEEVVRTLLECMNGKAIWRHANGRKEGYGFTVTRCLGVEEFDI